MDKLISDTIKNIARPQVCTLPVYQAGLTAEQALSNTENTAVANLSVNENPLGMSKRARVAVYTATSSSALYPDSQCLDLRQKLSVWLNIALERVIVGNGSEDILAMICKAFLQPGDQVLLSRPNFSLHAIYTNMMGAEAISVPIDAQLSYNLNDWLECIASLTQLKAVMIANPSNPVGCIFTHSELTQIVDACPANTLIVIDEAYFEFAVTNSDFANSLLLLAAQSRPWVVLRTFSKAYGLAGLRVGYAVASSASIVSLLDRVRTPYNVNRLAQAAAQAVIDDDQYLQSTVQLVTKEKSRVAAQLKKMGLLVAPSFSNFLFINININSLQAADYLLTLGVMVKPWVEPDYDTFIRMSIGTVNENNRFLMAMESLLSQ